MKIKYMDKNKTEQKGVRVLVGKNEVFIPCENVTGTVIINEKECTDKCAYHYSKEYFATTTYLSTYSLLKEDVMNRIYNGIFMIKELLSANISADNSYEKREFERMYHDRIYFNPDNGTGITELFIANRCEHLNLRVWINEEIIEDYKKAVECLEQVAGAIFEALDKSPWTRCSRTRDFFRDIRRLSSETYKMIKNELQKEQGKIKK